MRDWGSNSKNVARHLVAIASLSLLVGAGCNADEPTTPTADPLRTVEVPEGFTFGMTRGAVVELSFAERFLMRQPLTVELRRPDGMVVFSGGLPASGRLQAKLQMPKSSETLELRVRGRRGLDETKTLALSGETVALEVE